MLTVVIGQTGVGKSTFALRLAAQFSLPVVSAGGWIRERTGIRAHGPEAATKLADASTKALRMDPDAPVRWVRSQVAPSQDAIVEGVRSPRDLLNLVAAGDHVVDLGGKGVGPWERQGLAACRSLQPWLEDQGVTWQHQARHLAYLPSAVKAEAATSWLRNRDETVGTTSGEIVALESYPGEYVTCMFRSCDGGTFHDLPLAAFSVPGDSSWPGEDRCYNVADVGPPVVELPLPKDCRVFDRSKEEVGNGRVLYVLHWPEGNTLLYLVQCETSLLLWPPHKLMFGDGPLPDWKKLRH